MMLLLQQILLSGKSYLELALLSLISVASHIGINNH